LANVPNHSLGTKLKPLGFEYGPESAPKKGDSVLIVGAGPAGVHMASLLRSHGVKPILLEKESRVGGKSYTVVCEGVPHEMGTCYLHPEYHVPKALLKQYGLDPAIKPGGLEGDRDVYLHDTPEHSAEHFSSMEDWMYGAIEEEWAGNDYLLVPNELNKLPMLQAIRRYQLAHRKAMGTYQDTLPPEPSKEQWALMDMTFYEFLKENGCLALMPLLLLGHTAQGYGLLDTIPAFYGLMWFTADLCERFLAAKRNPAAEATLTMLKGGWSSLWQTMVAKDKLDVRLGHAVSTIKRSVDGVTCSGVTSDGNPFELNGSHIFLACPFPTLASAMDLSPDENEIFSALAPSCLCTTLYEIGAKEDRTGPIAYWPDALNPNNPSRVPGMLNCERWSAKSVYHDQDNFKPPAVGNPSLAATAEAVEVTEEARDGLTKHVRVGYQFLDRGVGRNSEGKIDAAALQMTLQNTLKEQGVSGVKIHRQYPWDYFFRFSQADLVRGLPWKLLKMQGSQRTFYIGASAVFESINDVTNYNNMIARQFGIPPTQTAVSDTSAI